MLQEIFNKIFLCQPVLILTANLDLEVFSFLFVVFGDCCRHFLMGNHVCVSLASHNELFYVLLWG